MEGKNYRKAMMSSFSYALAFLPISISLTYTVKVNQEKHYFWTKLDCPPALGAEDHVQGQASFLAECLLGASEWDRNDLALCQTRQGIGNTAELVTA